jgi:23S rRNA pseudouridine2605 synthase
MEERLQKILSRHGAASRRSAEELIKQGRVRVNGNTARLGESADESEDVIELDGKRLGRAPARLYIMLNKPRGYVTTLSDEQGRKNVAELVAGCGERVYPVGRLDLWSEGLLLLTNDGALAQRLTHPKNEVPKTYLLWVSGYEPGREKPLSEPIAIEGRLTSPAEVKKLSAEGSTAEFEITLHEGRNRQIRRLCEEAGLSVTRLKRIREGTLSLGELPCGAWRELTPEELASLRESGI